MRLVQLAIAANSLEIAIECGRIMVLAHELCSGFAMWNSSKNKTQRCRIDIQESVPKGPAVKRPR